MIFRRVTHLQSQTPSVVIINVLLILQTFLIMDIIKNDRNVKHMEKRVLVLWKINF